MTTEFVGRGGASLGKTKHVVAELASTADSASSSRSKEIEVVGTKARPRTVFSTRRLWRGSLPVHDPP
jgi:hypothetical protein